MWKGVILQILERYLPLLHVILVKIVLSFTAFLLKYNKAVRVAYVFEELLLESSVTFRPKKISRGVFQLLLKNTKLVKINFHE